MVFDISYRSWGISGIANDGVNVTSNRIWLETVWIPQHRLIIYMKHKPLCHIYLHLNTATYSRKYTRWQSINFGGLLLVVFYHILKRRTDEILYFCNIVISYFLYRIVFHSESDNFPLLYFSHIFWQKDINNIL